MLERNVDGVAIMTFGVEEFLLDRFVAGEPVPVPATRSIFPPA